MLGESRFEVYAGHADDKNLTILSAENVGYLNRVNAHHPAQQHDGWCHKLGGARRGGAELSARRAPATGSPWNNSRARTAGSQQDPPATGRDGPGQAKPGQAQPQDGPQDGPTYGLRWPAPTRQHRQLANTLISESLWDSVNIHSLSI